MTIATRCGAALVMAGLLCSCESGQAGAPRPAAATLVLAVSSTDLAGNRNVDLTAQARDAGGQPVAGVPVEFSSDRGAVQVLSAVTDSFGTASARLGTVGTGGPHVITATARSGALTAQAQVRVAPPDAPASLSVAKY
jgi:hypothetical protein